MYRAKLVFLTFPSGAVYSQWQAFFPLVKADAISVQLMIAASRRLLLLPITASATRKHLPRSGKPLAER